MSQFALPDSTPDNTFLFVLSMASHQNAGWVLDSGATSCATFAEEDCVDVEACSIQVTAAGECFTVTRKGTAIIRAVDANGESVRLKMQHTLISPKFPYKLLALQSFTTKGFQVTMLADEMRITKPDAKSVLVGDKDNSTKLFFLRQSTPAALLARSYTDDAGTLWQLHLRHGHRNFADLARQYNLRLPKTIPHAHRV